MLAIHQPTSTKHQRNKRSSSLSSRMPLDYDNSAFYYFSITLLSIYLIPGTYYALSEVFQAFAGSGEIGAKPRTELEKSKAAKLKKESTGMARLKKPAFIVNLVLLAICLPIFIYLVALVRNDGEVNTFDPFQVLGIEQNAPASEVKKAYRKLSLKYHPDKNIGNKVAEEMFMKIAKAYEALTDETSKENYEKYGNPDGKQSLEVSIGLPRIILDNPKVVLVLYLIVMVVFIPLVVGIWYANSKQYGEKNIKYETYTAFYQLLQDSHKVKHMPEVMAASAECRALNVPKPDDKDPLGILYGKMKNEKLMQKPKYEHPMILRGNLLLHAHMLRLTETLTKELKADLDAMLAKAPELVEGIIEIAYQRKWLPTTVEAIKFNQCIVQGMWHSDHSLLQLPHFTAKEVKAVTEGKKAQAKELWEYLQVSDADKKGLSEMTEEQKKDVFEACKIIPSLSITHKLFVEEDDKDADDGEPVPVNTDDEKIFEQDLVTLRVTLARENVTEKGSAPPVYSPLFPKTIPEGWWVILTEKGNKTNKSNEAVIHAIDKISDQNQKIVHEMKFMAPPRAGEYEMELHVYSDCYVGLDRRVPIVFTVNPASELPEYKPHPEDVELDNEPTLFEQVMSANVDDSSDDEDDEDTKKPKTGGDDEGQTTEDQGDDDDEDD